MAENIPKITGYNPEKDLEVDKYDIQYGSIEPLKALSEYPKEFLPVNPIPDYQNGRPFCVLHGVSYAMRLLFEEDYSEPMLAAIAEWKEHFHSDGIPNEDYIPTSGTYIKLGLWAAQHYGACSESVYPPNGKDWQWLAQKKNISEEAYKQAHKIGLWTRIGATGWGNTNLAGILDAITKYKAGIFGCRYWNEGFYQEISIPSEKGTILYHCMDWDGWKGLDPGKGDCLLRYKNWHDHTQTNKGNGYAWGWMKFSQWQKHISGVFTITTYPRYMFKLIKAENSKRIWAVYNGWRFWVLDPPTLKQGAKKIWADWDNIVEDDPAKYKYGGAVLLSSTDDPL